MIHFYLHLWLHVSTVWMNHHKACIQNLIQRDSLKFGKYWDLYSFSQCSDIYITLLNVAVLYVKSVVVIRSAYLRAPFFLQNIHDLFLNSHSNMCHINWPLTQNNMKAQQMGPLNYSLSAHNIRGCCTVPVQWFIGVIRERNLFCLIWHKYCLFLLPEQ